MQLPALDQFQFLPGYWQAKVLDFLRPEKTQLIYLKIILIKSGIILSVKLKKKGMVELWNY